MDRDIYVYETIAKDWGQFFTNHKVIYEEKNDLQHLLLIDTDSYGKVLLIDGIVQVTEKDNFIYHEMLTHVPILSHGNCKDVLVIGGGDGGMVKEVLRYPDIKVTMVEIDESVVTFSRKYLKTICEDAFENPRLDLKIADGTEFVRNTKNLYDVIIVDSTDPEGPGEVLFTKDFYNDCKKALRPEGILVTQNGIPFSQTDELRDSVNHFRDLFSIGTCYLATVPSYIGGSMAFGFATDNVSAYDIDTETIHERFNQTGITTKYYNPDIHKASFALPNYVKNIID